MNRSNPVNVMCDKESTEPNILEAARKVTENLLPEKSTDLYRAACNQFVTWQNEQNTKSFSEETLLVYFEGLTKSYKPSSIWSKYSMLKSTLMNFHHVDIAPYKQLTAFLSKNNKGYQCNKSKVLEPKHVHQFLKEAPDNKYLAIKVALIVGINGACRREEIKNISIEDIRHHNGMAVISIPKTKNDVPRKFIIDGEFYETFKKYEALRPKNAVSDRFFLCLRNGKCTQQAIGINTFGAMPKIIAQYLKLEEPEKFTGHSFRRTSATILADARADVLTLKRHGGWSSDKIAMDYVADSTCSKKKMCAKISSSVNQSRLSTETTTNGENSGACTSGNSNADNEKENSSDFTNRLKNEKICLNLNNCQVTFNITKH